jgi:hypothetical protein
VEAIEFMDPKQRRRHAIMLIVGYILIGIMILMITVIFLFLTYGFGLKNGKVIQNGMVDLASAPNPAQIYINGELSNNSTNTRITLQAGTYTFELKRSGYRSWSRSIIVEGGQIMYYDYPMLFPDTLTASTVQDYSSSPVVVTQSPNQQWLMVASPGSLGSFNLYNLNNTRQAPTTVTLPDGLLSAATSSQSLQVVQWSNDNTHVLLRHTYDGNTEYILMDISSPDQSVNLTKFLALSQSDTLSLSNLQYDQYIIYDTSAQTLSRASLSSSQAQPYMSKVLAFKTYGSNMVLYVTPDPKDSTKVDVNLYDGNNTYTIRHDVTNTTYLLDLTTYNGDLYVVVSAESENTEYIYEDPVSQITDPQIGIAVPVQIFHITAPTYEAFSPNTQYIMFEGGSNFGVYDALNEVGYSYTIPDQLDTPQTHASWMDSAHLIYVSNGKAVVVDYDDTNRQILVSADPSYIPYFEQSYDYMYTLVPSATEPGHELLTRTGLLTKTDLQNQGFSL